MSGVKNRRIAPNSPTWRMLFISAVNEPTGNDILKSEEDPEVMFDGFRGLCFALFFFLPKGNKGKNGCFPNKVIFSLLRAKERRMVMVCGIH